MPAFCLCHAAGSGPILWKTVSPFQPGFSSLGMVTQSITHEDFFSKCPTAFRKAKGYRGASKKLNQLGKVEVKAGLLAYDLEPFSHKGWGCYLQAPACTYLQVWVLLGMGGS